jgi:hypothetical protein
MAEGAEASDFARNPKQERETRLWSPFVSTEIQLKVSRIQCPIKNIPNFSAPKVPEVSIQMLSCPPSQQSCMPLIQHRVVIVARCTEQKNKTKHFLNLLKNS